MNFNSLIFEILVVLVTIFLVIYMNKTGEKKVWNKFWILLLGVFLFQIMSEPMWVNNLNSWTYIYGNVSWIIALEWVSIFFAGFLITDRLFGKVPEKNKFWLNLVFVTIILVIVESILYVNGIREYAELLTNTFSGLSIPFTSVPLEVLLTAPLISALIIPFYRYISNLK